MPHPRSLFLLSNFVTGTTAVQREKFLPIDKDSTASVPNVGGIRQLEYVDWIPKPIYPSF
jgi:hypothetical protein